MEEYGIYAIGQQDFRMLREVDAVYIDKTAFIEKIVRSRIQYYFLVLECDRSCLYCGRGVA